MTTDPSLYNTSLSNAGLERLRRDVKQPSREGIKQVAKQFESLFVQTMLKSMRKTGMGSDMLNSEQTKQYRALFDQEIAGRISEGRGMGLAKMVERQLLQHAGLDNPSAGAGRTLDDYRRAAVLSRASMEKDASNAPATPDRRSDGLAVPQNGSTGFATAAATAKTGTKGPQWPTPEAFVRDVWPMAQRVADRLDVAPEAIVAQAALETGWGQHVIQDGDGRSSHNLFNIKAGGGWDGDAVRVPTMEYADGAARRETAAFRSYPSLQAAFDDYGRFLQENPRYGRALQAGGDGDAFVRELQRAGYATDPRYADKLQRIMRSEPVSATQAAFKFSADRTTT